MEKTYSMYDPATDAYREVSQEDALKFIESAKDVEKQIAENEALELATIDTEIARLQALKEKGGENE